MRCFVDRPPLRRPSFRRSQPARRSVPVRPLRNPLRCDVQVFSDRLLVMTAEKSAREKVRTKEYKAAKARERERAQAIRTSRR